MAELEMPRKKYARDELSANALQTNYERMKTKLGSLAPVKIASKYFMPDMSKVPEDGLGTEYGIENCKVYKVNAPGFIYRMHVQGSWNSAGGISVLVASDKMFTKAYLLMSTKGSVNDADHVNNMFPIMPGKNTYIMFTSDKKEAQRFRSVAFVPAVGCGMTMNEALTEVNTLTSIPSKIIHGATFESDSDFKKCFE